MRTNEIAGPIQTPNGFHIIRLVDERAIESKSDAPNRTQVEQLLMQRKFEEHAQNWVSKMRSQAFVSVNLKS
jgi:parvulin-like peptidyl-prolyl isomerase